MRRVRYEEMTAEEVAAARAERSLVYLPIASLEFHGTHLPVGTDGLHAQAFCEAVARKTGGVVLPVTWWGTKGHIGWEGSLLLDDAVLMALVREIVERLADAGYRWIVVCSGHYPEVQGEMLARVAEEYTSAAGDAAAKVVVLDPFAFQPVEPSIDHGGAVETSLVSHLRPDLVDLGALRTHDDAMKGVAETCVDGTPEEGRLRFEGAAKAFAARVEEEIAKG
jgi:creatinine amidohydrolase